MYITIMYNNDNDNSINNNVQNQLTTTVNRTCVFIYICHVCIKSILEEEDSPMCG